MSFLRYCGHDGLVEGMEELGKRDGKKVGDDCEMRKLKLEVHETRLFKSQFFWYSCL